MIRSTQFIVRRYCSTPVGGTRELIGNMTRSQVANDMRDLLREARKRNYSMVWLGVAATGVFGYASYGMIKNWTAGEAAGFTAQMLEDPELIEKATVIGKQVVSNIVNDVQIQEEVTKLLGICVNDLAEQQWIKDKLGELFKKDREDFLERMADLCRAWAVKWDAVRLLG